MWYTANLLFRSDRVGQQASEPLWEEQIVLFDANDPEDAKAKAGAKGKAMQLEFHNARNELVQWHFIQVERVFLIENDDLSDGCELFSRFLRDTEVQSLLTPFNDKN